MSCNNITAAIPKGSMAAMMTYFFVRTVSADHT